MGSGRDKKKKAKERKGGPSAGRGAEKTERKTRHNDEKKERRTDKRLAGVCDTHACSQTSSTLNADQAQLILENLLLPLPGART